jgi:hypothetical protein
VMVAGAISPLTLSMPVSSRTVHVDEREFMTQPALYACVSGKQSSIH